MQRRTAVKRTLAILLILSMLLGALSLIGCPSPAPGGGTTTPAGSGETPAAWADDLDTEEIKRELGGETLTISLFENYQYEIYATEDEKGALDQLIYKRNKKLEERFGVTLAFDITPATGDRDMGSHYDYIEKELRGMKPSFDLIAMMAYQSGKFITSGHYRDWRKNIPYARESLAAGDAWWPSEMNRQATVKGRQFVAVSDLSLTLIDLSLGVIFNEDLVQSYNVAPLYGAAHGKSYETMYDIVKGGAWTLDAMIEMTKDHWHDNAEGGALVGVVDAGDTFGFWTDGYTEVDNFAWSSGFTYVNNDGISDPTVWTLPPTFDTLLSTLRTYLRDNRGVVDATSMSPGKLGDRITNFSAGRIMFTTGDVKLLKNEKIRGMDNSYGILPYPKFTEGQAEYLTSARDNITVLSVPKYTTGKQLRLAGAMTVALSAETRQSINDTYYEMIVKHDSGFVNRASLEMLDIIMRGRVYELVIYHYEDFVIDPYASYGKFGLYLRHLIMEAPHKTASGLWEGVSDRVHADMKALVAAYEKIK